MRSFRTTKLLARPRGRHENASGLIVPARAAKKQAPSRSPSASATSPTSCPAIVGVEEKIFEKALGKNVSLELSTFNSGTSAHRPPAGALDAATSARAHDPRGRSSTRA
jgi:hypothetical protein